MDLSDQGGMPPARIRDEQRVTPLEALLRPGLRLRPHPGNRLPLPSPHVGGGCCRVPRCSLCFGLRGRVTRGLQTPCRQRM